MRMSSTGVLIVKSHELQICFNAWKELSGMVMFGGSGSLRRLLTSMTNLMRVDVGQVASYQIFQT